MRFDVEMIRSALRIEDVITEAGIRLRNGRGPCLLCGTSGTSTSFSVRNARFRCFACGEHGDVVELLAKLNGTTWYEAIPIAAKMAGVEPGQRVIVKERREDPRIFYNKSFREIAALRDVLETIAGDEAQPMETRATALWASMEANDTLDFILEEAPWR